MTYGSPFSEALIAQLSDKEIRDEFVADQVRTRIALLIRALREQDDRRWSQTELGRQMNKPQSVVSRLEDPVYGKQSLQTLLEVAAAFDLPLWIDIPEWDEWLRMTRELPNSGFSRQSFNANRLANQALRSGRTAKCGGPSAESAFNEFSSKIQNIDHTSTALVESASRQYFRCNTDLDKHQSPLRQSRQRELEAA